MKPGQVLGDPTRIKVLRYQRIVESEDLSRRHGSCLHMREFRRQLDLLERWGYTTITFNDYRLFLKGELNLPRKPVVLTFDGAYLDNYHIMFPILQKVGATAVVFVHGDRTILQDSWNRASNSPKGQLMEGHHIVELHAGGVEIGSHSMTNANLATLPDEKASEEITRSRILLEILLNAPVLTFAYPFGIVDTRIKQMVAEAGYTIACGSRSGPSTFGVDLREVRRLTIPGNLSSLSFRARLLTD